MNRLLLETHELDACGRAVLRDTRARHIREILRASPGKRLRAGIVEGTAGWAQIEDSGANGVAVRFEPDPSQSPATIDAGIDLLLALPRPKVLHRLLSIFGMLGVGRVVLCGASRVEADYFGTHWLEPAHYRAPLVDGAEQAATTSLPIITLHRRLEQALNSPELAESPPATRWLGAPGPATPLPTPAEHNARVCIAVGPEGGWLPEECARLTRVGFQPVSLGTRILRSDIACIALLAMAGHARALNQAHGTDRSGEAT